MKTNSIPRLILFTFITFIFSITTGCTSTEPQSENSINMSDIPAHYDTATFGSGCFWCTEAIFQSINGVVDVSSGYMGGDKPNPTYKEVCTGTGGHAEVVQIIFDPNIISYPRLLEAFWGSHDPTTLNRQGNDVGTQYRSVVFYHNEDQKKHAVEIKDRLNREKVFPNPIVTEISPASTYYIAENYHQEYYDLNGNEPYCTYVIKPKLDKFKKTFSDILKK
jgi:peptide-methionine (S)-S-oxide reductase